MLGHETSLIKFQGIEILQSMFSDCSGMKLEISNKEIWRTPEYMEIKQHTPISPMGQRINQKGN